MKSIQSEMSPDDLIILCLSIAHEAIMEQYYLDIGDEFAPILGVN